MITVVVLFFVFYTPVCCDGIPCIYTNTCMHARVSVYVLQQQAAHAHIHPTSQPYIGTVYNKLQTITILPSPHYASNRYILLSESGMSVNERMNE